MIRRTATLMIAACVLGWSALVLNAQNHGGNPEAAKVKNPIPATAKSIETGQKLYQMNCRHCHGATGLGDGPLAPKDPPPPANLTDAKWDHGSTDGEIFSVIKNGAGPDSKMKPMKAKLSDNDIWNVVNYIRTLGPKS